MSVSVWDSTFFTKPGWEGQELSASCPPLGQVCGCALLTFVFVKLEFSSDSVCKANIDLWTNGICSSRICLCLT